MHFETSPILSGSNIFGTALGNVLVSRGFTEKKLARRAKIHTSHIYNYLRGTFLPEKDRLKRMVEVLEVRPQVLVAPFLAQDAVNSGNYPPALLYNAFQMAANIIPPIGLVLTVDDFGQLVQRLGEVLKVRSFREFEEHLGIDFREICDWQNQRAFPDLRSYPASRLAKLFRKKLRITTSESSAALLASKIAHDYESKPFALKNAAMANLDESGWERALREGRTSFGDFLYELRCFSGAKIVYQKDMAPRFGLSESTYKNYEAKGFLPTEIGLRMMTVTAKESDLKQHYLGLEEYLENRWIASQIERDYRGVLGYKKALLIVRETPWIRGIAINPFSEMLTSIMIMYDLSQKMLARKFCLSESMLSEYIAGHMIPGEKLTFMLKTIDKEFGKPPEETAGTLLATQAREFAGFCEELPEALCTASRFVLKVI